MSEATKISWTDSTFNPWWGCQKVGPGCDHCYAEVLDKRTGGDHWGPHAERRRTSPQNWHLVDRWQAHADAFYLANGRDRRAFCGSMMDIFDNAVPQPWTWDACDTMERATRVRWQPLTKRLGNVVERVPPGWVSGKWPKHIGLMITVATQSEVDRDVKALAHLKELLEIPWVGLSVEPLLERVSFFGALRNIDWAIIGGESGTGSRRFDLNWARSFVRDCREQGVAPFVKQMGSKPYDGDLRLKMGGKADDMSQFPVDLRVREFPAALI